MGERKVPPATADQVIARCYALTAKANEEATAASGEMVRCLKSDQTAQCLPKTAASYTEKRNAASSLQAMCTGIVIASGVTTVATRNATAELAKRLTKTQQAAEGVAGKLRQYIKYTSNKLD